MVLTFPVLPLRRRRGSVRRNDIPYEILIITQVIYEIAAANTQIHAEQF